MRDVDILLFHVLALCLDDVRDVDILLFHVLALCLVCVVYYLRDKHAVRIQLLIDSQYPLLIMKGYDRGGSSTDQ